ncbi:unnamed protein product [Nesidiocoris tenuis]|uniref:EGF-like domain-containing protein n=1 Tax=Nesidiocoris tenuis TaxID=355587 RepID=A0A6H5GC06_9HEMI|nr:unnamed protein product [Nesidiocoris tenuis]
MKKDFFLLFHIKLVRTSQKIPTILLIDANYIRLCGERLPGSDYAGGGGLIGGPGRDRIGLPTKSGGSSGGSISGTSKTDIISITDFDGRMVNVDECGLRPDICGGGQCTDTPDGYSTRAVLLLSRSRPVHQSVHIPCVEIKLLLLRFILKSPDGLGLLMPSLPTSRDGRVQETLSSWAWYDQCRARVKGMSIKKRSMNASNFRACAPTADAPIIHRARSAASAIRGTRLMPLAFDALILTNANVCRASAKEASVVTHLAASAVTAPRATNCQQTNDTAKGSYGCRCKDGFVGDGVTCRDINECLTNNGGCNQHAQCRNTQGSYECVCDAGFRGDGVTCTDIDECAEHPMYCQNGHCLNQPGNYRCECEMGFMHPDSTETACVGKQLKTIFHDKS